MSEIAVQRYKEASQWLLRLNHESPPEADVAEWLRWCEEDEQNLQAFEKLQSDWRAVVALREDAGFVASGDLIAPRSESFRRHWRIAAAAAVIAAALGIAMWSLPSRNTQEITAGSANKTATLPDGSLLTLRAQAAVNVGFTGQERRLEVGKESEAYFKVRHDPSRPFIVRAGELTITAVGTAFDVKHEQDLTWVTVEEGKVRISSGQRQWMAAAGQRLEYSPRAQIAVMSRVDAVNTLRWRQGEFAYVKVPLATVIEEINRYSSRRIAIPDERVRAIPYTGTVFVESIDDWLPALATKYPVRTVPGDNGAIALVQRTTP